MKSDVIHVNSEGAGVESAVKQAEAVAAFKSLDKKGTIHLILLTEEMMGMMQALTGEKEADFWIDDKDGSFRLHLLAETLMNAETREKLLSTSTSGKNAAAKGVMGKIRDIFSRIIEPSDDAVPTIYAAGWNSLGVADYNISIAQAAATANDPSFTLDTIWSLNKYKEFAQSDESAKEEWDELEKSIIANIADEIEIGIAGNKVEMIIYKKF